MTYRIKAQQTLLAVGDFALFTAESMRAIRRVWRRRGTFLRQCEFIGVQSLPVVTIAAMFMGAVLAYQLYVVFHRFGAEGFLGGSVGVALFKELGPVMCAVMVTGRAGAAIAAEIATMRVSEQIDALEVMAVDPVEFLVTPRVLAGLVTMPLASLYFTIVASLAAAGVACGVMGLSWPVFSTQYAKVVDPIELIHCVVKGGTFGFILTTVACFCGFRASGGARSVGQATRTTVVASFLVILLFDYILTSLLPYGFAKLKAL